MNKLTRTGLTCLWLVLLAFAVRAQDFADSNGCVTAACHGGVRSNSVVHAPLEDECETCHEPGEGEHPKDTGDEFSLAEQVPDLCYMCHDTNNEKANVHSPVADGDCVSCHSPHSSNQPSLLVLEDDTEIICEGCHELELEKNTAQHGPVASKYCTSCHEVHQSDHRALLKQDTPELCFGCHGAIQEEASLPTVHGAFEDDCLGCHQPHGSQVPAILLAQEPELCYGCHDDIEEGMSEHEFVHAPFQEKKSCLQCHFPHSSRFGSLLKAEPPQVCFDCHKNTSRSIRPLLKSKIFMHAPVAEGECTACHSVHSSDTMPLLNAAFPSGDYAKGEPASFALCFECHDEALLESKVTTLATDFRNGDKNLHFVHVNQEKGRSCHLCHDIHASDNPYLISDFVSFGTWKMPINFSRKDDGGSCLPGCHDLRSYARSVGQ